MSSTSRSPDGKVEPTDEPEKKQAGSPGRYSLADDADDLPPTRIDSTTRMPAVRPELAAPRSVPGSAPMKPPPPSSASIAASRAAIDAPKDATDGKKKPPIGLPSRTTSPRMTPAAPASRNAAPVPPPSQRTPSATGPTSGRLPDVRPPAKSSDFSEELAMLGEMMLAEQPADAGHAALDPAPTATAEVATVAARPASGAPPDGSRNSSSHPPKVPSGAPAFSLEGLDEGSIAFAFDALVSEDRAGLPGTHDFDLAPVRELFAELAANHMRHVRDFMIDVKWGEVTRDWIHICVPPVRTLRKAAERLDLVELGAALEKLGDELDAANAVGGQMLDANEKERLLDTYGELVAILPQAFGLDRDQTQREAVIVQALLLQVPDVRKVTIDKLHAAGLTGLTVLFEANAHDIAHVAGIPHLLATRIVERVQAYRAELQSSSPQDARAAEREKLAGLNGQLKRHHAAYEEAANAWGPETKAKKRDHFRAREETWLEISVLLARFGEVDRLQGIEKVPFAQRIAQLSDYLEEARDKYRSAET
ncbi:MAG: hypothetical protein BGO98_09255 [Myxococcales bacterium 68-20]|nr:MAG: hypothetical protein BGO98_09255 [Myxococcales bacterium 68-20]